MPDHKPMLCPFCRFVPLVEPMNAHDRAPEGADWRVRCSNVQCNVQPTSRWHLGRRVAVLRWNDSLSFTTSQSLATPELAPDLAPEDQKLRDAWEKAAPALAAEEARDRAEGDERRAFAGVGSEQWSADERRKMLLPFGRLLVFPGV